MPFQVFSWMWIGVWYLVHPVAAVVRGLRTPRSWRERGAALGRWRPSGCYAAAAAGAGGAPAEAVEQQGSLPEVPAQAEVEHLEGILQAELLFSLVQTWAAAARLLATFVAVGPDTIPEVAQLALFAAPATIRACVADASLARSVSREPGARASSTCASLPALVKMDFKDYLCRPRGKLEVPFALSKADTVDATTDGLSIVAVWYLERDPLFHQRLLAAWGSGPVGRWFAPLVISLRLSRLMIMVQLVAGVAQWGSGFSDQRVIPSG